MADAVFRTELPGLPPPTRGKVRDVYDLGDRLLIVSTDRLSAFDHVLPNPIPGKGKVLNQISTFWFERFARLVPGHLIETDVAEFRVPALPRGSDAFAAQADALRGRSAIVRKLRMFPVECVARGYLAGSGWKEYRRDGRVCGIPLPPGLRESSKLPEPIFTPATKAVSGHDENIPFSEVERLVGAEAAARLRDKTLELYLAGSEYAAERGILIADTKFEFGLDDAGRIVLGDEVLTPDSSRFWPAERYEEGRAQPSFDKQFVRDWLEASGWDKEPPIPELPGEVVSGTRERYLEIFRILTGHDLRE